MKWILMVATVLLMPSLLVSAQSGKKDQIIDLTASMGKTEGILSGSYVNNWKLGRNGKWLLGLGLRFTGYTGHNKDFITAPARVSRSTTIPFAVVFSGQETKNWDTLSIANPLVASLNVSANVGYNIGAKWGIGFNIDLIGFSLGPRRSGILTSNGFSQVRT